MAFSFQVHVLSIGALFVSIFFINDCKELDGYNFPVYTTSTCPANEMEHQVRSMKINCSDTNLYICVPCKNFTYLCEFCYIEPVLAFGGMCHYLDDQYVVESFSCIHFTDGCSNETHFSHSSYTHPNCAKLGNGCILADPSCPKLSTKQPRLSTKQPRLSTKQPRLSTKQPTNHDTANHNDWWEVPLAVTTVFLMVITLFCVLILYRKKMCCCTKHFSESRKKHRGNGKIQEGGPFLPKSNDLELTER
uniref:Uncharacterized protein LOC111111298 n=1 Tax=Crassostrea virginica TaxID=6565 RepID=A0A8B8BLQ6_CRAVI|nr:uncharacterized protein LOC111111298 [Crassostrea virginica]XP_022303897.1 uncharacterized protein LOC111111298 [Crassostrea virginica]